MVRAASRNAVVTVDETGRFISAAPQETFSADSENAIDVNAMLLVEKKPA
jgi:hypothetical protein